MKLINSHFLLNYKATQFKIFFQWVLEWMKHLYRDMKINFGLIRLLDNLKIEME